MLTIKHSWLIWSCNLLGENGANNKNISTRFPFLSSGVQHGKMFKRKCKLEQNTAESVIAICSKKKKMPIQHINSLLRKSYLQQ